MHGDSLSYRMQEVISDKMCTTTRCTDRKGKFGTNKIWSFPGILNPGNSNPTTHPIIRLPSPRPVTMAHLYLLYPMVLTMTETTRHVAAFFLRDHL